MQHRKIAVAAVAALSGLFCLADVAEGGDAADGLVCGIRESVRGNWDEISDKCTDVLGLMQEMPNLPESAWFSRDKEGQRERIRKFQGRIRELLLSECGQSLMRRCDELESRIADQEAKVQKLVEKRQFSGDASYDKKLAEAREELKKMRDERDAGIESARRELAGIGLRMDGNSGDVLFKLVNRTDIVDNAILAKSVSEIVENLRQTVPGGDGASARRYFGVYLVLADLQIACYEQYLEKSRGGVWRERLASIETNALETITNARRLMADRRYTQDQKELFRRNVSVNNTLLAGVGAYRKLLDCHERVVERKLGDLRRMRDLAENSFATASNAADLSRLLSETQRDYSAILELELPEIDGVDDEGVREQLQAITRMLDTGR